jgi:hypothetical protein
VSAETAPREVFQRLSDGSYEVFEEGSRPQSSHSFWVSSTVTKATNTLLFDAVPAEMEVPPKKHEWCNMIHRDKMSSPPNRLEPTTFPEYVADQPNHVRQLLHECDLSEITTQKRVSLICSPGAFSGGTNGWLLKNGLGTFGFLWADPDAVDDLLPIGKGQVPGASLIMSST